MSSTLRSFGAIPAQRLVRTLLLAMMGLLAACGQSSEQVDDMVDFSPPSEGVSSAEKQPPASTGNALQVDVGGALAAAPALPPAASLDEVAEAANRTEPEPLSLTIPGLDLDQVPVIASGVTATGEMEVPSPLEVGWYRYGPTPGEPGSAVLAGHIASEGVDGAFRYLERLKPGDQLSVAFNDGSVTNFVVDEVVDYAKSALPFDELFARSGTSQLALITCGGDFDAQARSYEDNLVVVASVVA